MTTLKDKLKNTLTILKQAGIKDDIPCNIDLAEIENDRLNLRKWTDTTSNKFVSQIKNDKVPHHILDDEMTKWIFDREKHTDIYDDFVQYWKSEGLSVVVKRDSEGNDVLTLTILPDNSRGNIVKSDITEPSL